MGKMIESGGGKKNAQNVMITITILNFPLISGYGKLYVNLGCC